MSAAAHPDVSPDKSYETVYQRMLRAAKTIVVIDADGLPTQPLASLNLDATQDFTLALLSGWAVVADILSFYLDRIADEGYLNSAVEDESVYYLAEGIGYQPWPGAASDTWLAVTVASQSVPQDKNPLTAVSILPGTSLVVQNIPAQGALPVFFEAEDEAEVRVEWNQLLPVLPMTSVAPVMTAGMTGIRLAAVVTSVKPGSPLLLVSATSRQFRILDTVDIKRSLGYTAVTWQQGLEAPPAGPEPIKSAYVFRQQSGLFGRLAPAWSSASDAARSLAGTRSGGVLALGAGGLSWKSIQGQLPAVPVRALLCAGSNPTLFAATQSGLYVATGPEWSANWVARPTSNSRQDLYCLFLDDRGFLYAGGTRGSISCSKDLGHSWQSLSLPIAQAAPDQVWWKQLLTFAHLKSAPPDTSLPAYTGAVRAVVSGTFGKSRSVFFGTDSGVFELPDAGEQWQPFSEGLPGYNSNSQQSSTTVFALRFESTGKTLLAGTSAGLYSRDATGSGANQWKAIVLPVSSQPAVLAIFSQPGGRQDVLYAGTSAGLFVTGIGGKWQREPATPETCSVNGFAVAGNYLLAATSAGLFYMDKTSGTWESRNQQEVALFSVGNVFADALNRGEVPELLVELFAANGVTLASTTPKAESRGTVCWQIEEYLLRADGDLLAVSGVGPLTQNTVQAIAADSAGNSFLAGPTGEFLESEWPGFQLTGGSVALDRIASAVQPGDFVVFDQPSPQPTTVILKVESSDQTPFQAYTRKATVTVLHLPADPSLGLLRQRDATVYLKPSSVALYIEQKPAANMLDGKTVTVSAGVSTLVEKQKFAITGRAPVVIVSPNVDPTLPKGVEGVPLKKSDATSFTAPTSEGAELDLETVSPTLAAKFQQSGITLNQPIVSVVERGSSWVIYSQGSALGASSAGSLQGSPATGFVVGLANAGTSKAELQITDTRLFTVQAAIPYPRNKDLMEWTLFDGKDTYMLVAAESGLVFCPSSPSNPAIGEILTLEQATVAERKDATVCVFEKPPTHLYDPGSVSLTANLVHATQGATIASETLGNGDATIPNQTFTLQRPPVTWLNGGKCTLELYVSSNSGVPAPAAPILNSPTLASQTPAGDPWSRVETLFGAAPGATVYTLATDSRGASAVTFGDGVQGARLPTGYGNVVATYRTGLGPTVLPPGSLTVFRNRPAGIRAVTNPVPAQGGTNPEAVPSMRSRMTFAARSIDRIVSLNDYQSFALSQDEVIKAHVDAVATGAPEPTIYLTVGVRGDLPIHAMPGAAERLRKAIYGARASDSACQVAGFNAVYFSLQARIKPDGTVKPGVLEANIRAALVNAFSFDLRLFAQDVTAADVISVIQNVAGVYDASLEALYIAGDAQTAFTPPATPPPLKSNPPRWDPTANKILPADLLIINPDTASTGVKIVLGEGAADETGQIMGDGQP
jgi:hypothetical protein